MKAKNTNYTFPQNGTLAVDMCGKDKGIPNSVWKTLL